MRAIVLKAVPVCLSTGASVLVQINVTGLQLKATRLSSHPQQTNNSFLTEFEERSKMRADEAAGDCRVSRLFRAARHFDAADRDVHPLMLTDDLYVDPRHYDDLQGRYNYAAYAAATAAVSGSTASGTSTTGNKVNLKLKKTVI